VNKVDIFGLDTLYFAGDKLYHYDADGNQLNSWPAVSGGYGEPAPSGIYDLSGPVSVVPCEHQQQASYCDPSDNCWWQAIEPTFETHRGKKDGRLGIHPDGNVPGTEGCIGVTSSDTSDLYQTLQTTTFTDLYVD